MENKISFRGKKAGWIILVLIAAVLASLGIEWRTMRSQAGPWKLRGFLNDFSAERGGADRFQVNLGRQEKYLAYSRYIDLIPGKYRATFDFQPGSNDSGAFQIQLATDKGRRVIASRNLSMADLEKKIWLDFDLPGRDTVEPRVLWISGTSQIVLKEAAIGRLARRLNWLAILQRSVLFLVFGFLALFALVNAWQGDLRWRNYLAALLLGLGVLLIMQRAWLSDDAMITMRHVDNFLAGHGPVYNPGVRVEGFTHTLWFYVLVLLRWLGMGPKAAAVLPGLFFSALGLYILFFRFRLNQDGRLAPLLNFAGPVLIGMSAFRDFGTSGLETGLTYFLLILLAFWIWSGRWRKQPVWQGLWLSLLILNRPDFAVFFIFWLGVYLWEIIRKRMTIAQIGQLCIFPIILVGGYQIFRMGYYAALFPNPVYAKSASQANFLQGWYYLLDLLRGSLAGIIIVIAVLQLFRLRRKSAHVYEHGLLIGCALVHAFFVVRGGGDFMHGRFLLPAIVLITCACSGFADSLLAKTRERRFLATAICLGLLGLSLAVNPLQRGKKDYYPHGIADERFCYYGLARSSWADLVQDNLMFMWRTSGVNYRQLQEKTGVRLRLAFPTIGYFGYYAGRGNDVIDQLGLTDPVVARLQNDRRGRPGHEKSAPFPYLVLAGLTFGDTPFELWNQAAATPYGVLWDLSRRTLGRFAFFLPPDFKARLDQRIQAYLQGLRSPLSPGQKDFLYFLNLHWRFYAPAEMKTLFSEKYSSLMGNAPCPIQQWQKQNFSVLAQLESRITAPLTGSLFLSNIRYALLNSPNLSFSR